MTCSRSSHGISGSKPVCETEPEQPWCVTGFYCRIAKTHVASLPAAQSLHKPLAREFMPAGAWLTSQATLRSCLASGKKFRNHIIYYISQRTSLCSVHVTHCYLSGAARAMLLGIFGFPVFMPVRMFTATWAANLPVFSVHVTGVTATWAGTPGFFLYSMHVTFAV